MVSNDWDGVSSSTTDISGDNLHRKDTQLDYFHKSASFLEDCLDPAHYDGSKLLGPIGSII